MRCGGRAAGSNLAARAPRRPPAQELKHRKSSNKKKLEVFDEEEITTAQQREAILEELRAQARRGEEALEAERKRGRAVALEVAELRGRLAHAAKEHGQWEQDSKAVEQQAAEAAMVELRRLRRAKPLLAARIAAERSAGAPSGGGALLRAPPG